VITENFLEPNTSQATTSAHPCRPNGSLASARDSLVRLRCSLAWMPIKLLAPRCAWNHRNSRTCRSSAELPAPDAVKGPPPLNQGLAAGLLSRESPAPFQARNAALCLRPCTSQHVQQLAAAVRLNSRSDVPKPGYGAESGVSVGAGMEQSTTRPRNRRAHCQRESSQELVSGPLGCAYYHRRAG